MLASIATVVVTMLTDMLPLLSQLAPTALGSTIAALEQILPVAIKEAQDIVPEIQAIVAELTTNAAITPAQAATLAALDAQCDAAFEAAAAAAGQPANPSA